MVVKTHHEEQTHETRTQETETPERRMSRRRALTLGGGGLAAVVGLVAGGALLGGNKKPSTSNRTVPGEGMGGEQPQEQQNTPVDLNTPEGQYHIDLTVQQDPELRQEIEKFMGSPGRLLFMPQEYTDGVYPNLTVATPDFTQELVMKLQPVGRQAGTNWAADEVPKWEAIESDPDFDPSRWQELSSGTQVFYVDDVEIGGGILNSGRTTAQAWGRTGIGTEHEAAFSVDAIDVRGVLSLPPDQRRDSVLGLTGSLFNAGAFGPVTPAEQNG